MAIDQVARTYCAVNEGKGQPVDGSYTETAAEGSWSEMVGYADMQCAAGGELRSVTATVTRKPGALAECRVRTQVLDGKDPSGTEMPGGSRNSPSYSLQVVCVPQPILTHKLAESIQGDKLEALKALVNGAHMGSKIDLTKDGEKANPKTIKSILGDDEDALVKKIKKGITSFYSPQVSLQARYVVKDPGTVTYQEACKISTPPGPFSSPGGKYNWLSMGTGVEGSGREWTVTDTYLLSGPDGWDKDIYSK